MAVREIELTSHAAIDTSDYVRTVTSLGASRKTLASDFAKMIVETYTSDLGGSEKSLKDAITDLDDDTEIEEIVIEAYRALGWADS